MRRLGYGRCPDCGKWCYESRKQAKEAIRQHEGREGRLNAYACGRHWHIGHLPDVVRHGDAGRGDIFVTRRRAT